MHKRQTRWHLTRWGVVAALAIVAALCGVALRPSAVRAQANALIATAEQRA